MAPETEAEAEAPPGRPEVSLSYPFVITKTEKKPTQVVFDASWLQTEKGNTMLQRDEDRAIVAWIRIAGNVYMEIADTPDNSPRLQVCFIESTPAELTKSIRKQCKGWAVIRWNLTDKIPANKDGFIK